MEPFRGRHQPLLSRKLLELTEQLRCFTQWTLSLCPQGREIGLEVDDLESRGDFLHLGLTLTTVHKPHKCPGA